MPAFPDMRLWDRCKKLRADADFLFDAVTGRKPRGTLVETARQHVIDLRGLEECLFGPPEEDKENHVTTPQEVETIASEPMPGSGLTDDAIKTHLAFMKLMEPMVVLAFGGNPGPQRICVRCVFCIEKSGPDAEAFYACENPDLVAARNTSPVTGQPLKPALKCADINLIGRCHRFKEAE